MSRSHSLRPPFFLSAQSRSSEPPVFWQRQLHPGPLLPSSGLPLSVFQ
uniref:Uncharacterized protein n=1 Tax=Arundo donax TaxID=35708 RepID=A0A0A8ZHN8_ARUDO